jgi:hypothetical protein
VTPAHGGVDRGWRGIAGKIAADIRAGTTRAAVRPRLEGDKRSLLERYWFALDDHRLRGSTTAETRQDGSANGYEGQGAQSECRDTHLLEGQGLDHQTGRLSGLDAPILRLDGRRWL